MGSLFLGYSINRTFPTGAGSHSSSLKGEYKKLMKEACNQVCCFSLAVNYCIVCSFLSIYIQLTAFLKKLKNIFLYILNLCRSTFLIAEKCLDSVAQLLLVKDFYLISKNKIKR